MWQTELVTVVGQLRLIRSLFGPFRCMPFDQNTRTPHENSFVIHSVQKSQSVVYLRMSIGTDWLRLTAHPVLVLVSGGVGWIRWSNGMTEL